jgi:hypothetical protein
VDGRFEASPGYIGSFKPAWVHSKTVSQKRKKDKSIALIPCELPGDPGDEAEEYRGK